MFKHTYRQSFIFISVLTTIVAMAANPSAVEGKDESKVRHSFVDKSVAGLVIGKDNKEQAIRMFGPGEKISRFGHGDSLLYFNPYGIPLQSQKDKGFSKWIYRTDSQHDPDVVLSYDASAIFKNGRLQEIDCAVQRISEVLPQIQQLRGHGA